MKGNLQEIGFKSNPFDACVGNKMINGKQYTIRFHVDNLMSSHGNKKINDEFEKWLNNKYGEYGEVTASRGKSQLSRIQYSVQVEWQCSDWYE